MGINVDALAFRLFQQKLQILQIMTGDHDKRPFFHLQRNRHRNRSAIRLGIGTVQKFHTGQIHLACLHHYRKELFRVPVLRQDKQCPVKEFIDFFADVSENHRKR